MRFGISFKNGKIGVLKEPHVCWDQLGRCTSSLSSCFCFVVKRSVWIPVSTGMAVVFCQWSQSVTFQWPCDVGVPVGVRPSRVMFVTRGRRYVSSRVGSLSVVSDDFWLCGICCDWQGIDFVIIMKNFGNILKKTVNTSFSLKNWKRKSKINNQNPINK